MTQNYTLDLLAKRIEKVQQISAERATAVAREIGDSDADIREAALKWATTGIMPALPVIENVSPDVLEKYYRPSQVFTMLMALRQDPVATKRMAKWLPKRPS